MKQAMYSQKARDMTKRVFSSSSEQCVVHVWLDSKGNEVICTNVGDPENYNWDDKVIHEFPVVEWIRNEPA